MVSCAAPIASAGMEGWAHAVLQRTMEVAVGAGHHSVLHTTPFRRARAGGDIRCPPFGANPRLSPCRRLGLPKPAVDLSRLQRGVPRPSHAFMSRDWPAEQNATNDIDEGLGEHVIKIKEEGKKGRYVLSRTTWEVLG